VKLPKIDKCPKCTNPLGNGFTHEFRGAVKITVGPHTCDEALIYSCKDCGYSWNEPCADAEAKDETS